MRATIQPQLVLMTYIFYWICISICRLLFLQLKYGCKHFAWCLFVCARKQTKFNQLRRWCIIEWTLLNFNTAVKVIATPNKYMCFIWENRLRIVHKHKHYNAYDCNRKGIWFNQARFICIFNRKTDTTPLLFTPTSEVAYKERSNNNERMRNKYTLFWRHNQFPLTTSCELKRVEKNVDGPQHKFVVEMFNKQNNELTHRWCNMHCIHFEDF